MYFVLLTRALTDAGAWTEEEAYKVYREKLVRLRDLYVGQMDHMRHALQEKRRQFLLRWQHASRKRKAGRLEAGKYEMSGFIDKHCWAACMSGKCVADQIGTNFFEGDSICRP